MKTSDWRGIMKILEVQYLDPQGNVKWVDRNIRNVLHQDGEEFLLRAAFTGGQTSTIIPDDYYLGLDNRTTIADSNTMDDLIGEPTSGGYARQTVNSSGDFVVSLENDHYLAKSPIVTFRATSGSWGPCANLFLTDKSDASGYLISTAVLSTPADLTIGESVTMRISMQLKDCV